MIGWSSIPCARCRSDRAESKNPSPPPKDCRRARNARRNQWRRTFTSSPDGEFVGMPEPIEDDAVLFRFRDFGIIYWEGGVGQQPKLIPWHRARHVMFDRGVGEKFGFDSP